eukprot:2512215-Pleurochrysis_carterae.AAC.3
MEAKVSNGPTRYGTRTCARGGSAPLTDSALLGEAAGARAWTGRGGGGARRARGEPGASGGRMHAPQVSQSKHARLGTGGSARKGSAQLRVWWRCACAGVSRFGGTPTRAGSDKLGLGLCIDTQIRGPCVRARGSHAEAAPVSREAQA